MDLRLAAEQVQGSLSNAGFSLGPGMPVGMLASDWTGTGMPASHWMRAGILAFHLPRAEVHWTLGREAAIHNADSLLAEAAAENEALERRAAQQHPYRS